MIGRALFGGSNFFGGEALGWIGRDMEFLDPEILRCEPWPHTPVILDASNLCSSIAITLHCVFPAATWSLK